MTHCPQRRPGVDRELCSPRPPAVSVDPRGKPRRGTEAASGRWAVRASRHRRGPPFPSPRPQPADHTSPCPPQQCPLRRVQWRHTGCRLLQAFSPPLSCSRRRMPHVCCAGPAVKPSPGTLELQPGGVSQGKPGVSCREGARAGRARCPARPAAAQGRARGHSGGRHEVPACGPRPVPKPRGCHSPYTSRLRLRPGSGLLRLGLLKETRNPQKKK